ncbi:MAG: 23S rRNA (adenine(2030)-N(6))-methyltransferase RlmJ [Treponema sp.]|jgi:23S rRNA (adenine2030-N6)-methyltransferase|nr:23S rRNA (adenine(2030)-N(6))-methyltransferase RlmJ [Treponema sp.]
MILRLSNYFSSYFTGFSEDCLIGAGKIMLSYRHGFHAGNQADVLKHAVLISCLDYLAKKPKPFLYIDTHAGAGSYRLDQGFAAQNREWSQGIGRFLPAPEETGILGKPLMISRYLRIAGKFYGSSRVYAGSPLLAAELLRPQDRACCFELHPADFTALTACLGGDRRFRLRKEDGPGGLKSLLPPESHRGLVFIDPSYELKEDYRRLIPALEEGLRRFPGGIYIIWYPLLLGRGIKSRGHEYGETLLGLYGGRRCRTELRFGPPGQEARLYGCGLVLFNPPWTLKAELEESLPVLAGKPGNGEGWELIWEE